jgi:hypothetical protein
MATTRYCFCRILFALSEQHFSFMICDILTAVNISMFIFEDRDSTFLLNAAIHLQVHASLLLRRTALRPQLVFENMKLKCLEV